MGIHAAMLPTGKVMWFSYPQNPSRGVGSGTAPNTAQAWLWDPATGAAKRVDPPLWLDPADGVLKPANIWCAGQTFTADGRLVVFGGNLAFSSGSVAYKGLNKVYTFNPWSETWREQPDMRQGRWYPTGVRMADGRIAIMAGLDDTGGNFTRNPDIELFTPSADMNGSGTVTFLGTLGGAGKPPLGGLYPHMFAMPSGRVMVAGPFPEDTWFLSPPGPASTFGWQDIADTMDHDRVWGTGVLVPGGANGSTKVMQLGGAAPGTFPGAINTAVNTTEIFDEANTGPGWQPQRRRCRSGAAITTPCCCPTGRWSQSAAASATRDGDQWAGDAEQRQIELWNPATGNWTLGPSQAETRAYHSTALLLPDGRVISAGDDVNGAPGVDGTKSDTAEIYDPPYLFKGSRPTISSAPPMERVGDSFIVYTPDTNITGATLVAPGATTHANDMNQRYIPLTVAQRAGGVTLTAPANADIATPGYYMLFLLNNQGVPSVAKFMRLGYASEAAPPPTPLPVVPSPGAEDPSGAAAPRRPCQGLHGKPLARCQLNRTIARKCGKKKGNRKKVCVRIVRARAKCRQIGTSTQRSRRRRKACFAAVKSRNASSAPARLRPVLAAGARPFPAAVRGFLPS